MQTDRKIPLPDTQRKGEEMQIEIVEADGALQVRGPYSEDNNEAYRSIGGKWDRDARAWVVSTARVSDLVSLFGTWGGGTVQAEVRLHQTDGKKRKSIQIGGYVLASRRSRDRAAELGPGVTLISGTIPPSGGSMRNPAVNPSDDAVFALDVPIDFAAARGLEVDGGHNDPDPDTDTDKGGRMSDGLTRQDERLQAAALARDLAALRLRLASLDAVLPDWDRHNTALVWLETTLRTMGGDA